MQQPRAFGRGHVQTHLSGHEADDVRDLDRMMKDVLRKAVSKLETPEKLHDLRVHRRQPACWTASSPDRMIVSSISAATFVTTSSMRVG